MFQARAVAHFKPNTQNLNQIRELLSVAWNLNSNMGGGAERLKTGMWKRKRQIFVETEAGSSKRVPLPLWPFLSNVEKLYVVQFFVKYMTKYFVQETNIC